MKKSNARRIRKRLEIFGRLYDKEEITQDKALRSLEGWLAYAAFANTYKFRKKVTEEFNRIFSGRH